MVTIFRLLCVILIKLIHRNEFGTVSSLMMVLLSYTTFQVEAGDVIVKVNGADVHRFSTKEGEYLLYDNCIVQPNQHSGGW